MRFGVGELGWIVFAPFLVFLQSHGTFKRHLALIATLLAAWLITVAKIITSEIPWTPAPMFAVPIAFSYFIALGFAGLVHRKLGPRPGVYAFASIVAVMGWIQYSFTPGASWGVLAHTQIDSLPIIQLAALTGLGGITFLVALGSGLAAAAWTSGVTPMRRDLVVFAVVLGAVLVYGHIRVNHAAPGKSVRIGSVISPVTHNEFAAARQNADALRPLDGSLFERSGHAVDLGASVVVWNEIATVVNRASEQTLTDRGQAFAKDRGVMLLMAYGVVDSVTPLHYLNKYRVYLPDGTLADEYLKRHPGPGDPETPRDAHARVVLFDGTKFTGAICYDYSFPAVARDNANEGAGIALVPSSDWRGIDPLHGRMALMNAVAVGLPMVRPVRAATSIVSDQYGRLLGSLRWGDENDGVMVTSVPSEPVPTLYARTGEIVPLVAFAFCIGCTVRLISGRRR